MAQAGVGEHWGPLLNACMHAVRAHASSCRAAFTPRVALPAGRAPGRISTCRSRRRGRQQQERERHPRGDQGAEQRRHSPSLAVCWQSGAVAPNRYRFENCRRNSCKVCYRGRTTIPGTQHTARSAMASRADAKAEALLHLGGHALWRVERVLRAGYGDPVAATLERVHIEYDRVLYDSAYQAPESTDKQAYAEHVG